METLVIRRNPLRQIIKMVERERQLWERRAQAAWQRLTPLAVNQRASRDNLRQQIGITNEEPTTGRLLITVVDSRRRVGF